MNSNKTTKVSTEQEATPFGNLLLPAVILSLGFELVREDFPTYRHKKHVVKLQKLGMGGSLGWDSYFFQIPHNITHTEWTTIKRVETDEQIKELFFVLWGVYL